jgi:hypothetical protein
LTLECVLTKTGVDSVLGAEEESGLENAALAAKIAKH